jgi:hypothetical protein
MADVKVEDLAAIASPALTDLLYVVADPGGTPASKKATLANIALALGFGALTDWTPTITQSSTITKTIVGAKYCRIGQLVFLDAAMNITGAGSTGNAIIISNLPVAAAANGVCGTARIDNTGTLLYEGAAYMNAGAGQITFRAHLETNDIGADPSFALANGDVIKFHAMYVAA